MRSNSSRKVNSAKIEDDEEEEAEARRSLREATAKAALWLYARFSFWGGALGMVPSVRVVLSMFLVVVCPASVFLRSRSVSYTHLDVYKRQTVIGFI